MRIPVWPALASVLLLTAALPAFGQPAPAAAPRQPVHSDAPVVPPQGSVHAQPPGSAKTAASPKPAGDGKHAAETAKAASPKTPPPKTAAGKPASGKTAAKPPAKGTAAKGAPPPAPPTPAAPVVATPAPAASAEKLPDPEKPEGTAAKLPRFASLRSDEVNMRAGPGGRYRIEWVYKRRDLPVEIEREYDVWRYVRDADGIQGWMQQATLMGRRSFVIQKAEVTMRAEANDASAAVAVLQPGVIGRIRSCAAGSDWCNVQTGSYRGWLRRNQFWGTLPNEVITP